MKLIIFVLLLCAINCPALRADDVQEIRIGGQYYTTDGAGNFWHNGSRFRGFDD